MARLRLCRVGPDRRAARRLRRDRLRRSAEREWPDALDSRHHRPLQDAVDWITDHLGSGVPVLGGTVTWAEGFTDYVLNPLRDGLLTTPWWALALLVGVVGWIVGTWRAALTAVDLPGLIGVMRPVGTVAWTRSRR